MVFTTPHDIKSLYGSIPQFETLSGYPLFYADSKNRALCADCASKLEDDETLYYDVNYCDNDLSCDECGAKIRCAYGNGD